MADTRTAFVIAVAIVVWAPTGVLADQSTDPGPVSWSVCDKRDVKDPCDDLRGGRLIGTAGETVVIVANYEKGSDECKSITIEISEEKRELRIFEDLKDLRHRVEMQGLSELCIVSKEYTLLQERGRLKVAVKRGAEDFGSSTIVTGPKEKWFLTVDLPVNQTHALKYDAASKQLIPRDQPQRFYLGLNYTPWGDAWDDLLEVTSFKEQLSIKLMAQLSSKPLDSFGVGLGYTITRKQIASITGLLDEHGVGSVDKYKGLSPFTVFAGRFWIKEDQIDNGVALENNHYKTDWRVGISFSVHTAKDWLK